MIVAYIPSFERDGDSYAIDMGLDGTLRCACPAFSFGPRLGRTCKHLRIYVAAEKALLRCRELGHGGPDGWLCARCLHALLVGAARKVQRYYRPKQTKAGAKA